jgi:hypothetical protein
MFFQMYLHILQRQLNSIFNHLKRTFKYQTNIFGYKTQLKSIGNTEKIESILRKYIYESENLILSIK